MLKSIKFIALILITLVIACTSDKGKLPKPENPTVDSSCGIYSHLSAVSYSTQVQNIINVNCVSCHDATTGIKLYNYANLKLYAASGQLVGVINGDLNYTQMPPTGPLDSCSIKVIKYWVSEGFPND